MPARLARRGLSMDELHGFVASSSSDKKNIAGCLGGQSSQCLALPSFSAINKTIYSIFESCPMLWDVLGRPDDGTSGFGSRLFLPGFMKFHQKHGRSNTAECRVHKLHSRRTIASMPSMFGDSGRSSADQRACDPLGTTRDL